MTKFFLSFLVATSLGISHFAFAEEPPQIESPADPKAPADHNDAIKSMMPYLKENDSIRKGAAKKYGPTKSKKSKSKPKKSKSKNTKKKKSPQKKKAS